MFLNEARADDIAEMAQSLTGCTGSASGGP